MYLSCQKKTPVVSVHSKEREPYKLKLICISMHIDKLVDIPIVGFLFGEWVIWGLLTGSVGFRTFQLLSC